MDPGQVALMERDNVADPELDLRVNMMVPARDLAEVLAEPCPESPERRSPAGR